jgi:hypothetical protein
LDIWQPEKLTPLDSGLTGQNRRQKCPMHYKNQKKYKKLA